jgi:hypothetical protein
VDLQARARGGYEDGSRSEPVDLALDVVHGTEDEHLMSSEADQIREGSSLHVVAEPKGRPDIAGHDGDVEVVLGAEGRAEAWDDLDREPSELIVLIAARGC